MPWRSHRLDRADPRLDMTASRLRLAEYNGVWLDAYRLEGLGPLFSLAARTNLLEVA
jgi:hypothetical protein